jgi:hypothetical protein
MKELVRVDRNGTKYYTEQVKCYKCNGAGRIPYYYFNEGGICFNCGGTGHVLEKSKEYTPEYAKKLEERRAKKQAENNVKRLAEADKFNRNFCYFKGFNENGIAYFVLGNTYDIKGMLKDLGGKFYSYFKGWVLPVKPENLEVIEISANELFTKNEFGEFVDVNDDGIVSINKKINDANNAIKSKKLAEDGIFSNYVGNIGDKIEVKVKIENVFEYNTNFSYYGGISHIYIMKDENNNTYTWNTANWFDKGATLTLKGTIKDHKEYKGVKQTVLTRCKEVNK